MSCPNKSSKSWQILEASLGTTEAMAVFRLYNEDLPSEDIAQSIVDNRAKGVLGSLSSFDHQRSHMQGLFNAEVVLDNSIQKAQVDAYDASKTGPTIRINPSTFSGDSLLHEYGHIFIDLMGGIENHRVKSAYDMLIGGEIYNHVLENYNMSPKSEKFKKEVVATALGIEANILFPEISQRTLWERFVSELFTFLRDLLGLPENHLRSLAKDLINKDTSGLTTAIHSSYIQEQTASRLDELFDLKETVLSQEEYVTKKIETIIAKKIEQLKNKVAILSNSVNSKSNKDVIKKTRNKIQKHIDIMEGLSSTEAAIEFIKFAHEETEKLFARLNKEKENGTYTIDLLKRLGDYANAYSNANEVMKYIKDTDHSLSESEIAVLESLASKADTNHKYIEESRIELSKNFLAKKWAQKAGKVEAMYRERYSIQFNNTNEGKTLKGDKRKQAKQAYINNLVAKNLHEIKVQEIKYLRFIMDTSYVDMSDFTYWTASPRDVNDDLISLIVEMMDRADFRTQSKTINKFKDIHPLVEAFKKERGNIADQEKLYENMLENIPNVDDNNQIQPGLQKGKNHRLVSEYYSEFYKIKFRYVNAIDEAKDENEKEVALLAYEKWAEKNVLSSGKPSSKWLNPQYKELIKNKKTAEYKLFNAFVAIIKAKDELVPDRYRLGNKLPNIESSFYGRIAANGLFETLKQESLDAVKLRNKDTEFAEAASDKIAKVLLDERDKVKKTIPIFFRGPVENTKDLSKDLATILLTDYSMSVNYAEKSDIQATADFVVEVLQNRDVAERDKKGLLQYANKLVTDKGTNKTAKFVQDLVNDRIYGISQIGNIKHHKIVGMIMSWTSSVNLMFNYLSMGANIMQGKSMNFIESKGTFIDEGALMSAELEYYANATSAFAETGKINKENKLNVINEYFDVLSDFSASTYDFTKNSQAKGLMSKDSLYLSSHIAEHYIQTTLALAILKSHKIKSTGKSLFDSIEVINGKIKFDPTVGSEDLFVAKRLISSTLRLSQGNYASQNKSNLQRTVIGKMLAHNKGWLFTSIQKRWGGIFKQADQRNVTSVESEEFQNLHFQREKNIIDEGYYTTTLKYLKRVKNDLEGWKIGFAKQWKNSSDQERARITQTIYEVGMIAVTLTLSAILKKLIEDDEREKEDKLHLYYTAFFTRRLYSEMSLYLNPVEFTRIMNNPTVSMSMISKILDALFQLTDPFEEYEDGSGYKITKKIKKIIPLLSQADRNIVDSYNYLYSTGLK